jgi:serine/threonine-protein kinase
VAPAVPAKPVVPPAVPAKASAKPVVPAKPAAAPKAARPAPAAKTAPAGKAGRSGKGKPAEKTPPPPPQAPDPMVGKVIGRCLLEEKIGEGRTGIVYRAKHQALDAVVAVKILRASAAANPQLVEKFDVEAKAIAKIDNENVLKVYDVGNDGGLHFMVMELLDGESILDLIAREGRMEVMDALRVTRQAANGMAAAHARGILHRDIKPQNLVLLEDGTVKVVDFGLAVSDEEGVARVGTPHYMAPEICQSGQASAKSDIYALGISLHHMLTGSPPFAGKDIRGILRAHIESEPLRPERARTDVTPEVGELVRLLTKKDPLVRPDAPSVLEALDSFGGKALKAKDSLRGRRHRRRQRIEAKKKSTMVPILLGVVLLGGAGVALAVSLGKGDSADAPTTTGGREKPIEPTVTSATPSTPTVVAPPPEDPAVAAAREKRMAEEKRVREGNEALAGVERWARENWHGREDTEAVAAKYRGVRDAFKGTPAAETADLRMKEIRAGKRHPHPDKQWSDADVVAQALEAWRTNREEVERLVDETKFTEAQALLPAEVQDSTGVIGKELAFWHKYLTHLIGFQAAVVREVGSVPEAERVIVLADGRSLPVLGVSEKAFFVLDGSARKEVPWAEVPPASIVALAKRAFAEKETRLTVFLAAYAYATRQRDEFFEAVLTAELGGDVGDYAPVLKQYKASIDERTKGR